MSVRCLFFGHKYVVTQKLTPSSRRLACTRCHRMFAMNDEVRVLVDWSADFHELYERVLETPITYLSWEGGKP